MSWAARPYSPARACLCRRCWIISKPGDSIDEFLAGFPTVKRELVVAFLEQAKDRLVESAK
jgi:hypothetical protein